MMSDKEKCKLIIGIVNHLVLDTTSIKYVDERYTAKIREAFEVPYKPTSKLDLEVGKFINKYEQLFNLYGIKVKNYSIENPYIVYGSYVINWMIDGRIQ